MVKSMKQVRIHDDVYEFVTKHGHYNESFTDILRWLWLLLNAEKKKNDNPRATSQTESICVLKGGD
jgi:predicted CopG family antitoxin